MKYMFRFRIREIYSIRWFIGIIVGYCGNFIIDIVGKVSY